MSRCPGRASQSIVHETSRHPGERRVSVKLQQLVQCQLVGVPHHYAVGREVSLGQSGLAQHLQLVLDEWPEGGGAWCNVVSASFTPTPTPQFAYQMKSSTVPLATR